MNILLWVVSEISKLSVTENKIGDKKGKYERNFFERTSNDIIAGNGISKVYFFRGLATLLEGAGWFFHSEF